MWLTLLAALGAALAGGQVEGWVFEAQTGRPVPGVRLELAGQVLVTDAEGHFLAAAEPGLAELRAGSWSTQVPVAEGQLSEVLLTLEAGQAVAAQVEAPALQEAAAVGPTGTVQGRVLDAEEGRPLAGVQVFVRGQPVEARTDAEGRFTLEVPAGTVELAALRSGYSAQTTQVEVPAGGEQALELRLLAADLALEDWTITAPRVEGGTAALLTERQEAATVNEVLGAEEMARAGATDAASALTRVTGLTLVGGRYIFVRGLGERYSATTLDGSTLPSPEPERRVVPLDLFPSATLDAVVVQKTWTPDLPGEFGGGALQLRSRRVPEAPVLRVGLSGGWDAATTFREAQVAPPGGWTGWASTTAAGRCPARWPRLARSSRSTR